MFKVRPGAAPNTFLIGAPKSGTTALAEYLDAHRDVSVSIPKEPFYFGSDLRNFRVREGIVGIDDYLACFQPNTVVVDATTLYLASVDAVDQIVDSVPTAKFIVATRRIDTMARSWSLHLQRYGWSSPDDAPEGWVVDIRRVCAVADQLDRLVELVDPSSVCLVGQSSLQENPQLAVQSVERFLGLKVSAVDDQAWSTRSNQARLPRSRAAFDVLQSRPVRRFSTFVKRRFPERGVAGARQLKDRVLFDRVRTSDDADKFDSSFVEDQQLRLDRHMADSRWGLVL